MAIDLDSADIYFGAQNHPLSAVWFAFTEAQRTGAVAHARQSFERALRRTMRENYTGLDYPDKDPRKYLRDDYAVFEQALHELRSAPQSSPASMPPYPVAADANTGNVYPYATEPWGREAMRWLGWTGGSVIRS